MNFGLERIHRLLDRLNRPDQRTKIIHVAGTNGKGSVCAYIASVLLTCGYSVGRFNSPHLIEPRDSININGVAISQSLYEESAKHVEKLNKDVGGSSFECLVATAFYAFDKAKLDFVVVEVGLGGLLDATNAIRHPIMTIITVIGLDHGPILGNTVEEIALAKAGIMKPNSPVVIAPQETQSIIDTLVTHAELTEAPLKLSNESQLVEPGVCKLKVEDREYTYGIQLHGDYQRMNSATAVTALDWLLRLGNICMTTEQLSTGMKNTRWPGRLDWIDSSALKKYNIKKMLVDGAHNPPASIALRDYLNTFGSKRIVWIIASTEGKDIGDMLNILIQPQDIVFAVPFQQPEGMPWIQCMKPSEITEKTTATSVSCNGLKEALLQVGSLYNEKDDLVVLCGSLYLVADLYRIINK